MFNHNNSESDGNGGGFLGFVAFLVTIFAAVLYLVALVLQFIKVNVPAIETMRSVASMLTVCVAGVMGWRFVKRRRGWLKAFYILLILVVVACVVVPIVLQYVGK